MSPQTFYPAGFLPEGCDAGFSIYDDTFLENTIRERISVLKLSSKKEYFRLLQASQDEVTVLQAMLTNSHSEFFRNTLTYSFIEQFIIPKLFVENRNKEAGEVRIWSAGCAAGQEACSMAILLSDYLHKKKLSLPYRIFGTDISETELTKARKGSYDLSALQNTRLQHINSYFSNRNSKYQISTEIQQHIDYSIYDLLDRNSDCPPQSIYGNFDVIFCCNVLYYYKPLVRKLILSKFIRTLKKGGLLITGEVEIDSIIKQKEFRQLAEPVPVFIKK